MRDIKVKYFQKFVNKNIGIQGTKATIKPSKRKCIQLYWSPIYLGICETSFNFIIPIRYISPDRKNVTSDPVAQESKKCENKDTHCNKYSEHQGQEASNIALILLYSLKLNKSIYTYSK